MALEQHAIINALAASLRRSPEWFPISMDAATDTVHFVHLQAEDYSRASFLDQRILNPQKSVESAAWINVAAAIELGQLTERCGFIFHIGHVGSTLLSRLIGAHPAAFSLREPMVLRILAQHEIRAAEPRSHWNEVDVEMRLAGCLKLFSRTYREPQIAIVKVSSFVSELAPSILGRRYAPKALMIFVPPEAYLATILGGPNSRQEARVMAPDRLRRLHKRIGVNAWRLDSLSEGETIALAWACEMSSLVRAANERTLSINFEQFLAAPAKMLLSAWRHFQIEASLSEAQEIITGPLMNRYSKAPEYAYDSNLRTEVMNSARAEHRAEIRLGLLWLARAAMLYPPINAAVEFAATEVA